MEVIPAIIPKSYKDLVEHLEKVRGVTSFVQIDIVDRKFTKHPSWPLNKSDDNFSKILNEENGMPFWEDFDYEIDLMVEDPLGYAKDWIKAGASRIVFHIEGLNYENDALPLDQLKVEGDVEIGIAIEPETPIEELKPYLPYADFVQVMGIYPVGVQGATFNSKAVDIIQWLKENYEEMPVSVDGGMNLETAEIVLMAGADRIVSGSFIFGSVNPLEAISELKSLV